MAMSEVSHASAPAQAERAQERATAGLIAGLKGVPASAKGVMFAASQIKGGSIRMILPDGRTLVFGDGRGPEAVMQVRDYKFARRLYHNGDIGLAEGLMAGEWESPDLATLLTLLADNQERYQRLFDGGLIGRLLANLHHQRNDNTREGAKRNILAHYDLGNRFYQAWLDRLDDLFVGEVRRAGAVISRLRSAPSIRRSPISSS